MSNGQIRTITRFYEKVILMPDTDVPGVKGGMKAARRLEALGVTVRVFSFQGNKDVGEAFELSANRKLLVEHLRKIESAMMETE